MSNSPPYDGERLLRFAKVNHRVHRGAVFGVKAGDLGRHLYVLGKTGMGKSTLLERLFVEEMRAGHGAALLDPHGDLAHRVLDRIPSWRRNDLLLLDPLDASRKVSLNLFGVAPRRLRPLMAAQTLSIFRKLFAASWGPRTEHLLRNCILALFEVPRSTLGSIPRLLLEERFRERALRHVQDPIVRYFWEHEFTGYSPHFRAEVIAPVQNKVGALLTNPILRDLLDTPKQGLSFRHLMDEGRLFIANLAKGRLGEDASAFLGSVLLGRIQLGALGRAELDPAARRPFSVYVDEFPSFVTPSFGEMLAEARKYGLAMVLANQHLGQLDPALRMAVLGNVGTLVAFRLGAEDALALAPEMRPDLGADDLMHLGRHEVALKLSVDGVTTRAFTATTLAVEEDDGGCGKPGG